MHMKFAVLCLLVVSAVVATDHRHGNDGCSLEPCGQGLGVYYLVLSRPGGVPAYEVVTFHADGTFNGIASNANGNPTATPPSAAFSNFDGVWKCIGNNRIEATDFLFNYPTTVSEGRLGKGVFELERIGNNRVSGTLTATSYELGSTESPDQSNWIKVATIVFEVKGYKLANRCGH